MSAGLQQTRNQADNNLTMSTPQTFTVEGVVSQSHDVAGFLPLQTVDTKVETPSPYSSSSTSSPRLSPAPAMSPSGVVSSTFSPTSSSSSSSSTPTPVSQSASSSTSSPASTTSSSTALPSAPLLPPCRVCGEKASGFHYGANTCEACKGFFRRSLARKANYRCAGTETCEIEPGKRSTCAYCRYQKCLAIGMSKEAIKTGRYTHEKKTRDIEEVKRLQSREAVQNKARGLQTQQEREAELEKIIKHITAAHLEQTPHSPEFFQKLPEKEAEYLEKRALQEKMFGPMKPIPREEYQQIYNTTGIDIDGRREMISQIIPGIEKAIKRFINFAKALPGFKELPIEDQIALIKGSRFENWFLLHYRHFNVEQGLYTFSSNEGNLTVDMYRWASIYSLGYIEHLFSLAKRVQQLHLLTGELAVLQAIHVFAPDRCATPEGAAQVERIQNGLINVLLYQYRKGHPYMQNMFARTVAIMSQMRTLENMQRDEIEKTCNVFNNQLPIPSLFFELLNVL